MLKRDAKQITKLAEELEKVSGTFKAMREDVTGLYEDLGSKLQRYYKINDVEEGCDSHKKKRKDERIKMDFKPNPREDEE